MPTPTRRRTPKPPVTPEREVQAQCKAWLEMQGCLVYRRNTGALSGEYKGKRRFVRFSEPGASDLYGLLGWRSQLGYAVPFECEIKRRGERPTLDQVEWLLEWHRRGAVAIWVDSLDRLRDVYEHVKGSGTIRYLTTTREYTVEVKGVKAKVLGPSGDYELT